jgi:hypothetical protein
MNANDIDTVFQHTTYVPDASNARGYNTLHTYVNIMSPILPNNLSVSKSSYALPKVRSSEATFLIAQGSTISRTLQPTRWAWAH